MKKIAISFIFTLFGIHIIAYALTPENDRDPGVVKTIGGPARPGAMGSAPASAPLNTPYGIAARSDGATLFIADTVNQTIRQVSLPTGKMTTLAGAMGSYGSKDGKGEDARFLYPQGIAIDPSGNELYVADSGNHTIRKIVIAKKLVTTLAGTSGMAGIVDAMGHSARFNFPVGMVVDPSGEILYVADKNNHTIRKIALKKGIVSTIAGSGAPGYSDGIGVSARFSYPQGIVIDPAGKVLYITDTNNQIIRKIEIETAKVSTLAGDIGNFGLEDGEGINARFFNPQGLTMDKEGRSLFVSDTSNHAIRKIVISTGSVYTFTGSPSMSSTKDGKYSDAGFNSPSGITLSGASIFLVDYADNLIRQIMF